jgi:hypothetical protein
MTWLLQSRAPSRHRKHLIQPIGLASRRIHRIFFFSVMVYTKCTETVFENCQVGSWTFVKYYGISTWYNKNIADEHQITFLFGTKYQAYHARVPMKLYLIGNSASPN